MKAFIIAIVMLFSLSAFASACSTRIFGGEPRCWEGNCKIVVEDGVVSEKCQSFCNFTHYKCNYRIACDGQECHNEFDVCFYVDDKPHLYE